MLSLAVLFLASCASSSSLRQKRLETNPEIFNNLSQKDQALVREGKVREGMPKQGVFLSWGRPNDIRQGSKKGVPYETWHYTATQARSQTHVSLGYGYGYGLDPYYRGYRGGYFAYPHFGVQPAVTTTYVPVRVGSVEFLNDKVVSWEARTR